MMFQQLKLAGFKSFADIAELDIEAGLTGIVGPNGCGKSNIVEALKWVMGESSARQMRSTEMDDVIFSGTSSKTARNLAEISLMLDNQQKTAPSEYNDTEEIEITRKIIRGKGTSYRINNRPARARDVQLLFADSATGARSAGIVSQGRIGAIVGAKPEDRRTILEEAANIKGLHQRKHEAELRLNSAELNISRLVDLMTQLEEQKSYLHKQARQAARYRSVADRIRNAEASMLHVMWISALRNQQNAQTAFKHAQQAVLEAQRVVNTSTQNRVEIAATLPDLRIAEAALAAETQLVSTNLSQIELDESRLEDEISRLQAQRAQIEVDSQREYSLQKDAHEAKKKLSEEAQTLEEAENANTPMLAQAHSELEKARLESQLADEKSAEANAVLQNLEQYQSQLETQINQKQSLITLSSEKLEDINLPALEKNASSRHAEFLAIQTAHTDTQKHIDEHALQLSELQTQTDNSRLDCQTATNYLARLTAEKDALDTLIQSDKVAGDAPISDSLNVTDDMEAALAACLSDGLHLPLGTGEDGYWHAQMSPLTSLKPPEIGIPIIDFIEGPDIIIRALQGVSVILKETINSDILSKLTTGQAVVTKGGKLARWDGLVRIKQDTGAHRIRQIQRVKELESLIIGAQSDIQEKTSKQEQCEKSLLSANKIFSTLQQEQQSLSQKSMHAQRDVDTSELAVKSATERHQMLTHSIEEAKSDLDELNANMSKIDDLSALQNAAKSANEAASKSRLSYDQCVQREADLRQTLHSVSARRKLVISQIDEWQSRLEGTQTRMQEMEVRAGRALEELTALKAKPEQLKKERVALTALLATSKQKHAQAITQVKEAEIMLQQADSQQRSDEKQLAEARETQIRQESVGAQAEQSITSIANQISEKLSISPDELFQITKYSEEDELPDLQQLEDRVNRLLRERDSIGPVNLRAEIEMQEISEKLAQFETDKTDLEEAIAKLRRAISELNKEARHRLLDSLTNVNKEFSGLFKMLFGGGSAELKLVNSDDPLTAGLEILASPPGKKLQSLSLLSGGEQALTGLAIIFAVFLTNPSPICILDEVDAPLDDSNVSRFCDLLRHIVSRTETKFLIVTHHRMTMSQMDRLYGVTMAERGISKLVSVDLQTAESLREDA